MLIVGQGALRAAGRRGGAGGGLGARGASRRAWRADWHGFNVLHTAAARVGALDLGFLPGPGGRGISPAMLGGGVDVLWLLGADEFDTARIGADTFVVYQGHHGDRGAARADVILPGAAYTEKDGTYVNTEGRVQRGLPRGVSARARRARTGRSCARSARCSAAAAVRRPGRACARRLEQVNPVFARIDESAPAGCTDRAGPAGDPAALAPRRSSRRSRISTRPTRSAAPARPWRSAPRPMRSPPRCRRRSSSAMTGSSSRPPVGHRHPDRSSRCWRCWCRC